MQRHTESRVMLVLCLSVSAAAGCRARANAASTGPAAATGAGPILVELFTSQGCSSCPAADAFVRDFPRLGLGRDRVVPLTFHVNYWDDLGWKDPFASPQFTNRQRVYTQSGALLGRGGDRGGITGAYTPQMIVAGAVHFSGARRDVAVAEIQRAAAAPVAATLTGEAAIEGDHAVVTARLSATGAGGADKSSGKSWRLFVALAAKHARTNVRHGENAGETLDEAAVVRTLSDPLWISAAPGATPVQVSLVKPSELDWNDVELTAFVQSTANLHVVAARGIFLPRR